MILQQYYTRERRGIFRVAEGYDTIAKSPSLDKSLIKKVFHSYCFYDPPRELQIAGEKDKTKYPKALTFLQLDTNETILGQSVYVPVDFTGQRSTFFTHNYLIPRDIKEKFIKNPEKILYSNEFKESYDIKQGMDLEEIKDLAYTRQNYNLSFANGLFEQLGITEIIFKNLIHAVYLSVSSRKKIYIALDVEAHEISVYAKRLLLCILESLPYEVRRKIGFSSYIQRPDSKKGINIMFVDKENIRYRTSGSDQDFIFDFPNKQFSNTKLEAQTHPYLDFIWDYRGNKSISTSLYDFIDQVLNHSKKQGAVDIGTYNNLVVLYQIIAGDKDVYKEFTDQIFTSILYYLNENNIDQQILLTNLARSTIRKESQIIVAEESYMSIKFAQNLIPYYPLGNQEDKAYICILFLTSLMNAKNTNQKEYIQALFESLQNSGSLIKELISEILGNPRIKDSLLNDYLKSRLNKIKKINQWGKEVEGLRNIAYSIIEEPYFQRESSQILLKILEKQENITLSGKMIYKMLEDFSKGSSRDSRGIDIRYVDRIKTQVDVTILKKISIKQITKQDLMNFTISPDNHSNKVKILYALKDLMIRQDLNAGRNIEEILGQVSVVEKEEIQDAIRNMIMELPEKVNYDELILAFYKEQVHGDETYDYKQLLTFIFTKKGKAGVYNFIRWSLDKDGFLNRSTRSLYEGYETAISTYFLKLDPDAFKDKELRQKFINHRQPGIRKFFRRIDLELASGFEKILMKYGDSIFLGIKYVFLIGIIASGIILGTIKITPVVLEKMGPSKAMQAEMNRLEKIKLENIEFKKVKEGLEQKNAELEKEKERLEKDALGDDVSVESPSKIEEADIAQ